MKNVFIATSSFGMLNDIPIKELDRKIVLNSVILKWDIVKKEFKERINF